MRARRTASFSRNPIAELAAALGHDFVAACSPRMASGTAGAARASMRFAVTLLLLGCTGCEREVTAQSLDPVAPVSCFRIVDAMQLAEDSAIQLCASATNVAPGTCFALASQQFAQLATQKLLSLCADTTSTEPVACFARLATSGTLTEDQMVGYCATRCALGPPPPEASHPACLDQALRATTLTEQSAIELCRDAGSVGPVQCFLDGRTLHKVSDSKLITLCAESRSCQYYNAVPQSY
jgi:hypothetical protein